MKLSITIAGILLLGSFAFAIVIVPDGVSARTLYVGGSGPGNYTTIQSAINAAEATDTVFVYNGTYSESVTIKKPLRLLGENRNVTMIDGSGSVYTVNIEAIQVTMSGFSITNGQAGVRLYDSQAITISENKISNNEGCGIGLVRSTWTFIDDNILSKNEGPGVYVFDSFNSSIAENNISGSYEAISVYDSMWITIENNNISGNRYGISVFNSIYTTVKGNSLLSNGDGGIMIHYSELAWVTNNYVFDSRFSIDLYHAKWTFVSGNAMSKGGITLGGDEGWHWNSHTIDAWNIVNGRPVYFWQNIRGGTMPPGAGQVILGNCYRVTVINQNVSDVFSGIQMGFGSNNWIVNNTASSNHFSGIHLQASNSNTLIGNNVSSNSFVGFWLDSSNGNSILNNTISQNEGFGLYIHSSSNGNRIYHNNFVDNHLRQAFDDTTANPNQWDDGYPSGGNYWSDYSGVDIYSGPNQNISGGDGIGDNPHILYPNVIDYYPLMEPFGQQPVRTLSLNIDPGTLNIHSRGRWITAYLTTENAEAKDIDATSLLLNDVVSPAWWRAQDNTTLMVKFDRAATRNILLMSNSVEIRITGQWRNGEKFAVIATIRVINLSGFARISDSFPPGGLTLS